MTKKIEINENGSISGFPEDINNLKSKNSYSIRGSLNKTDCSGTNNGDCTNAGICTDTTNRDVYSNTGTCDAYGFPDPE